jgi:hypothetical protein
MSDLEKMTIDYREALSGKADKDEEISHLTSEAEIIALQHSKDIKKL